MFFIKKLSFAFILFFSLSGVIYASEKCDSKPEKCTNLTCIRDCIDSIDTQIVDLIGQRLSYVKRAGEIKGKNIPIHDQKRENQILEKVSLLAEKQGYSSKFIISIYKIILEESNYYELESQ
jgi:isochorismate pyruvate lyase